VKERAQRKKKTKTLKIEVKGIFVIFKLYGGTGRRHCGAKRICFIYLSKYLNERCQ